MNIYIVKAVDERNDEIDFRFNLTIEGAIHSIGRLVYDYLDRIKDYRRTNPASNLTVQDIANALQTGRPVITLDHTFKVYVDFDILGN